MDLLHQMDQTMDSAKADAEQFYTKQNKAAGTRLRKKMQDIKVFATQIRAEVSELKNK